MQRTYKCLTKQTFAHANFKLVPIRDEDRYSIMRWRNEQINILRQSEYLDPQKQDHYFETIVAKLFEEDRPKQLLFTFLENDIAVGYGGLVHIDWENLNAEISFLTETKRNQDEKLMVNDWKNFLILLKKVAELLDFVKVFTFAYDIRPHLYTALLESNFVEEARLKHHVYINNKFYDVLIHSFFLNRLQFRMATSDDCMLYFNWANDSEVRSASFNSEVIKYDNHCKWFYGKLASGSCKFYLFLDLENHPVGQVRIENLSDETIIGISVDAEFRGKGISTKMLKQSTDDYLTKVDNTKIVAYIKEDNLASYKSFTAAGFAESQKLQVSGISSYKLIKSKV